MQKPAIYFLTTSLLLLVATAHAQVTFSVGPHVGLNLASAPFKDQDRSYRTTARAGLEAGLVASVGFGHFAVQPALLYSQKGFAVADTYTTRASNGGGSGAITTTLDERYRLNYFTIPLNFVYAQRPGGQGFQAFAGPYAGFLLGGKYSYDDNHVVIDGSGNTTPYYDKDAGDVGIGDYYTLNRTDTKFYSRSFDYGLQAGLGYRVGGVLVQAGYSLGLRNLGADFKIDYAQFGIKTVSGPSYYNRTVQVSVAYLFGPKE